MGPRLSLAVEALLATLAPPRCAACDDAVALLTVFCPSCARAAAPTPRGATRPSAAFVYGGSIARAIMRMKYESRPDLARPLGDLLWRALEPHAAAFRGSVVVPVPLHPSRLAERGFNQSALLARHIAQHMGAWCAPRALARTRVTRQQATLDRAERTANVMGAFEARRGALIEGSDILLVDDVMTTGATLDACEKALAEAGAARIRRVVLAAAPQRVEGLG
jgi:ComF family protein